jgi:putative SOS response-associated peptidase YedK
MCGRYTLRATDDELAERFDAIPRADFEPTYNASPGQSLPVVRSDDGGNSTPVIENLRWGLVPSWADDEEGHINARAETVAEKPSFADAYKKRRCLVPADGFYEWTDEDPWYVEFDGVVALAGIWERWVPDTRQAGLDSFGDSKKEGREELESFAVLTTEPNERVARLHHRMATVLAHEDEEGWLDGSVGADELGPRELDVDIRRVSERVNSPENDDASLVEGV